MLLMESVGLHLHQASEMSNIWQLGIQQQLKQWERSRDLFFHVLIEKWDFNII